MWVLIDLCMHFILNGISHPNSLYNSLAIAILVCWTERPFHHDIKLIFSQKCHMRRKKLIFFYFVKLNIISSMAIYPDKSKTNILYYVWYLNKHNFVLFFWAKKNIEQKTFVTKTLESQNMHILRHMSIFPKAHGT